MYSMNCLVTGQFYC